MTWALRRKKLQSCVYRYVAEGNCENGDISSLGHDRDGPSLFCMRLVKRILCDRESKVLDNTAIENENHAIIAKQIPLE